MKPTQAFASRRQRRHPGGLRAYRTGAAGLALALTLSLLTGCSERAPGSSDTASAAVAAAAAAEADEGLAASPVPALRPEQELNAGTVRYISHIAYQPTASSGTNAVFSGAEVRLADGSTIHTPPVSLQVPDNAVSYVYLTLHDLKLHVLPKNIHRGGVLVATVTAKKGKLQVLSEDSYRMPTTRIPQFLTKLRLGQETRVAVIGDSFELQFQDSSVRTDQFAAGIRSSHYGLTLIGRNADTGALSPLLQSRYDLAIVGYDAGKGSSALLAIESLVAQLRRHGMEVILLTGHPNADHASQSSQTAQAGAEAALLAKIGEKWGAEVADTWSFISERLALGEEEELYTTPSRLSRAGYKVWEEAIQSVTKSRNELPAAPMSPPIPMSGKADGLLQASVSFEPLQTDGLRTAAAPGTELQAKQNVVTLHGRSLEEPLLSRLSAGQSASYRIPEGLYGLDLLLVRATPFEAAVESEDGTVLATMSSDLSPEPRFELKEALELTSQAYDLKGSVTIRVTSGQADLAGIAAYWKAN